MKNLLIIGTISLSLLAGCENDYHKFSHKLPSTNITQDKSPTVGGVDADKNGIRDDIDSFIAEQYTTKEDQDAVRQMAKNVQSKMLFTDFADTDGIRELHKQTVRGVVCLDSKRVGKKGGVHEGTIKDILQLTLNTELRETNYKDYERLIGVMSAQFPDESDDGCDYHS